VDGLSRSGELGRHKRDKPIFCYAAWHWGSEYFDDAEKIWLVIHSQHK